tara:strand:+ start:406 stop:588 length:183 start_codon:yes stop_codon:yes gene_type:complete
MNEDLRVRILERFSLEEIAEAARVTPKMFLLSFEEEVLDNLDRLADIDIGFTIEKEEDEL